MELIRRAIQLRPMAAEFHANLGHFHQLQGRQDLAEASFATAVANKPDFAEGHHSLALALLALQKHEAAITAARRAIELRPNHADSHRVLGMALMKKSRMKEAANAFRRALDLDPSNIETHNNLGICLAEMHDNDRAIAAFQYAIRLDANRASSYVNLAGAYREKDMIDEAQQAVATALRLDPNLGAAHVIGGLLDFDAGRYDQAMAGFNRGLELEPALAIGNWNRGLLRLLHGDFENGWRDYEWRLKDVGSFKVRPMTIPQWDGSDLTGRRLLIHSEQGLGDTIQFIRFAPILAERGGRVIFLCHSELGRLLANFPGVEKLVTRMEDLPEADVHCPMLSLPHAMKIGGHIPAAAPYISAEKELTDKWASRLPRSGLRVGIVWAGRPDHRNDRNRSIHLRQLLPLFGVPGVRFFSLQKGKASEQIAAAGGVELMDWTAELNDFAETAALIASLDLVIAVDTAVAHLAGAMGKPVWILLPNVPDWRWMLERQDSPWYPTARLFRQSRRGDWESVIGRVGEALKKLATAGP